MDRNLEEPMHKKEAITQGRGGKRQICESQYTFEALLHTAKKISHKKLYLVRLYKSLYM